MVEQLQHRVLDKVGVSDCFSLLIDNMLNVVTVLDRHGHELDLRVPIHDTFIDADVAFVFLRLEYLGIDALEFNVEVVQSLDKSLRSRSDRVAEKGA